MPPATSRQILRFELAGENYAIDVLNAREVLTIVRITPLPTALPFLSGVINLRGSVIPVVDLRKKFQLPVPPDTAETSIVIVDVESRGENVVIGAIVDTVKGVTHCEASDMEPPPRFGMQLNHNLVKAIAKKDGEFIVILDAARVFSEDELGLIQTHSSGEQ
jgi:purine-binding chemotaxis protein CheW